MKTKLIFSTKTQNYECWTEMPFTPRINELINVRDILLKEEIKHIKQSSHCWEGIKGVVQSVEYRHDDNDFYAEIVISCED